MTTMTKYTTPGSHNLHVPTRTEFHRLYSNNITLSDFDTDHCQEGMQVKKIATALKKDMENKRITKKQEKFNNK